MRTRIGFKTIVLLLCLAAVVIFSAGWIINKHRVSTVRLPAVDELRVGLESDANPLDTPDISIAANTTLKQDGNLEGISNEVILHGARGGSFCLYSVGPFAENDTIESIAVSSKWAADKELNYRIGIADFADGEWEMSKPVTQGKVRAIEVPVVANPFNERGEMFIAIRVDNPRAAVTLSQINLHMNLAKGEPDHVATEMLQNEIIGFPVALPLSIRDENGRIVSDFNDNLTVVAEKEGLQLACNAVFTNGIARPTITFDEQGDYNVSIAGGGDVLDGELGTINLYETRLPVYSLMVAPEVVANLDDNLRSNQYQEAAMSVNGTELLEAKVRYRGMSRRSADKRSWKVKLTGKDDIDDREWGYDRESFNLITDPADTTMLREKLSYDLMRDMGVPSPRTRFIHLRVNDVFQGLYMDVENPRKGWLTAMGLDDDGSMYKASPGNLSRLSRVSEYEERYEKKTREDESYDDLAELCAYLDVIRGEDETKATQALDDVFFMEHLTNYVVALTLVSSRENWMHNYYLYHDMDKTGKWLVFPWDMDMTWSFDGPGRLLADDPIGMRANTNVLMSMFFNNPLLMERFKERMDEALAEVFTEERIAQRIDEYHAQIGNDVMADWQKKGTNEEYLERVENLKLYVKDRSAYLQQQLANS